MNSWLNNAVIYQVYPQSFYDTNADGIGDLRGIIEKLDYIRDCGFNAIWITPFCESTFYDGGYDITDFYKVDPRYGTNEDFRELCRQAHARGLRVIFDLVTNYTSSKHPWFVESSKAEPNEYWNRYIWTDGAFDYSDGISGNAQRDGNYIVTMFYTQPSLNYGFAKPDPRKPWQLPVTHPDCIATKQELLKIVDFWMDMGVDAFRGDMASTLVGNDPDRSATSAIWQEIRAHVESRNPECVLISEWGRPDQAINAGFSCDFLLHGGIPYVSLFRYERGRNTHKQFLGNSYFNREGKGDLQLFLKDFEKYLADIGDRGAIGLITGNHDMPRLAYRRTPEEIKAAMAFLFTLPGVPFVYYGDEIGMDYNDKVETKEGGYSRTGARTPMQWDNSKNHGFSTGDSESLYLPTDNRPGAPTVADQAADPESILSLVKALTALHQNNPALHADGAFRVLEAGYPFIYTRSAGDKTVFVAVNPSDNTYKRDLPKFKTVYLQQNVDLQDCLEMGGVSFIIAELDD